MFDLPPIAEAFLSVKQVLWKLSSVRGIYMQGAYQVLPGQMLFRGLAGLPLEAGMLSRGNRCPLYKLAAIRS